MRHHFFLCLAAICALATARAEPLQVISELSPDGLPALRVESAIPCPVMLLLEATLTNMEGDQLLPMVVTLPPLAKQKLITFHPIVKGQKWNWNYTFQWRRGDPAAKHDDRVIYRLPYPTGATYTVLQGSHGSFSHTGALENAIDWKMPIGSQVCAARDGVVVGIKADSNEGGPDQEKFKDKANYIAIYHADGTIGEYLHLRKDGVRVQIGQKVKAGDWIGVSGNTGFTSQPHLHFHVFIRNDVVTIRTVPINFRTSTRPVTPLKEGEHYTAL
jgi:murein DD-endopeptidase MepM/ murein hydrolase activator NlpD